MKDIEINNKDGNQIEEENNDENDIDEDHALDVKAKSFVVEDFEISIHKEEVGCIHEIVMPKGYKRGGINTFITFY